MFAAGPAGRGGGRRQRSGHPMTEKTDDAPEQERGTEPAPAEKVSDDSAETQAAAPAESPPDGLPENAVTVAEAGTLRKKVTVEISRARIDAKFDEMFGDLRRTAQVPGFRVGRAPRRLIEKRFGKEVAEDVRNGLVGEAIGQALEKADFKTLGQPDVELDQIELPDEGNMPFSFEVEVAPEFELPEYDRIEVRRPTLEITAERVEQAMRDGLRSSGRLKPTDSGAEEGDTVVADVSVTGEGIEHTEANAEFRVAAGAFEGIPVEDLPEALAGRKRGQRAEVQTTVPAGHPNRDWREKAVTIRIDVQEVKRLELPELDEEYAKRAGFTSLQQLRESVGARLAGQVAAEQRRLMGEQVCRHLLEHTRLEVPEQAGKRHADRLLARRVVDLMMRGVGREEIEKSMGQLEAAASQQAAQELKLSLILDKLAEAENVQVDDGEVNARIAEIAGQQNRRPERLRHEMRTDGTLETLYAAVREEKVIDKVLASATITDMAPEAGKPEPGPAETRRKGPAGARKKRPSKKK